RGVARLAAAVVAHGLGVHERALTDQRADDGTDRSRVDVAAKVAADIGGMDQPAVLIGCGLDGSSDRRAVVLGTGAPVAVDGGDLVEGGHGASLHDEGPDASATGPGWVGASGWLR